MAIREIGKYNHQTGQVEWFKPDELRPTEVDAPFVHGDEMPKTWHPGDGNYYESRCRYNATTRRLGLIEVGNEQIPDRRQQVKQERAKQLRNARIDYLRHKLA